MQGKHKKICIVTISLGKGGAERSCAMLSQMLTTLGHDVHMVLLNDSISYPFEGTMLNLGLLKKGKDTIIKRFQRFRKLRDYLIKERFDLILDQRPKNQYFRELFYHSYVYKGLATIYITHSANKENYLTNKPRKFAQICNKNVANVAVSHFIEEQVLNRAGIKHTTTIHNAFDPNWANESKPLPKALAETKYILSYGRLVDDIKDITFLLNSYQEAKLWEDGIHLVIMGEGPDKEKLLNYANSMDCAANIHFLGFHSIPFPIIKNAHFVTLTSRYEGFPMVLVESLSLGTPVVSLDIDSGPNEIIEDGNNGLLISERSLPLFSAALKRMVSDTKLYEHCKSNAASSVDKFSMTEIAKKWNQLLLDEN